MPNVKIYRICVCVCVCARARARVCVRERERERERERLPSFDGFVDDFATSRIFNNGPPVLCEYIDTL